MCVYKKYGIYGIRNTINNKIYVGKTMKSFGDRWDCHKASLRGGYNENMHLQRAWNKYGEESFEFIILKDCTGFDIEYVNDSEISEIEKYKNIGLSYNMRSGGDGGALFAKHLSEDAKKKIGEKNRVHMTGKKLSDDTKNKMRDSQNKRYAMWTDEDRLAWGKKMSNSLVGIKKPSLSKIMVGNKRGAKYTKEQVLEIRKLHEVDNMGYSDISKTTGIPRQAVYNIATYRRWKEV